MKYTYSDEEDEGYSDATTSRRSTRNTGTHTPAEGPTVTLSGRQVKSRHGGVYGESMLSGMHTPAVTVGGFDGTNEEPEDGEDVAGRPRRAAAKASVSSWAAQKSHIEGYNSVDEMDSEEEDASEQDYDDDEEEDDHVSLESDVENPDDLPDADEDMSDAVDEKPTLVIKLPVKTPTPERKVMIKLRLTPEPSKPAPNTVDQSQDTSGPGSHDQSTNSSAQPIDAPIASSTPVPTSPLAFRGSPEKPRPFPAAIDVGSGGI